MRRIILVFLLGSLSLLAFSQKADEAATLFNAQRYEEASLLYITLLEQNPHSALYHYRYARCLYELGDYERSIKHFALSGERYALRNYYMGHLHELTYRFDEAADYYEKYVESLDAEHPRRDTLLKQADYCRWMERYLQRVEAISITDSVVVNKDEFLRAYHLSHEAGTLTQAGTNICYTNQRNDRKFLSQTNAEHTQLYASEKLLDQWTSPHLLPAPLNQGDCSYPYIMADGITMYFASTHNSMGGYDIFITRYNNTTDTYLNPENIGMPFNSPANDYMMVIDENQGLGWWATDRRQPEGKVAIYTFIYKEEKEYVADTDSLLREKAQLAVYKRKERVQKASTQTIVPLEETDRPPFTFIINNQHIYNHPSDFQSDEALRLFQAYQALCDSVHDTEHALHTLRQEYQEGIEEERLLLTKDILALESALPILRQRMQELIILIRKEENTSIVNNKSIVTE